MHETFGQLLRRFRRSTVVTVVFPAGENLIAKTGPLSQNELARRAGVDAALVHRIERDAAGRTRLETVEQLVRALDLDGDDRARMVIAAGYWPWLDDPSMAERVLALVCSRTLEAS